MYSVLLYVTILFVSVSYQCFHIILSKSKHNHVDGFLCKNSSRKIIKPKKCILIRQVQNKNIIYIHNDIDVSNGFLFLLFIWNVSKARQAWILVCDTAFFFNRSRLLSFIEHRLQSILISVRQSSLSILLLRIYS